MADPFSFDPAPIGGPPEQITRGRAASPVQATTKFVLPGPVEKVVHYKDLLKCNHGGKVNLDPTVERNTEIKEDLRIVTDIDLLDMVTITGCSIHCTKIVDIPVGRSRDVELTGGAIPVLKNLAATTDKGCVVKWVGYEIDVDAAAAYLDKNAKPKFTGWCARYVQNAIRNSGIKSLPGSNAKDFGSDLQKYGFQDAGGGTVTGDSNSDFPNPQKGDVVVFDAVTGHKNGHTAMWDGKQWVSDAKQTTMASVPAHYKGGKFRVYRPAGNQAHAGPK